MVLPTEVWSDHPRILPTEIKVIIFKTFSIICPSFYIEPIATKTSYKTTRGEISTGVFI
jgi:hypothetical protein